MEFLHSLWSPFRTDSENEKVTYLITVATGSLKGAGTNASVSLVIKGTNGETESLELDKESRLSYDDFAVANGKTNSLDDHIFLADKIVGGAVKTKGKVLVAEGGGLKSTKWIILSQLRRLIRSLGWTSDEFVAGQRNYYRVTCKDVGEPLLVVLKRVGGWFDNDWFVDRVTIKVEGKDTNYDFPCNRWVEKESTVFEGTAKLPTDEQHDKVKAQREEELKDRRLLYKWGQNDVYSDLPGFVKAAAPDELPKDVQFTDDAANSLTDAVRNTLLNLGLERLLDYVFDWEDFNDYRQVFTKLVDDVPQAADHWKDDRFFGFQFLNGCNPESIERCTKLPPNFPVTQELVGNQLDKGDTLEKALKGGRIYKVDYKILEDIPPYGQNRKDVERRYMCASLGLFYVKESGHLMPIAIQLHQQPSSDNPIWTPNDSELDWLSAKLWLRNSDTQFHQMITHLLRTHLFMEPVTVASYRHLPTIHPLWKLLSPHIRGVLAINTFGRGRLIADGGVADNTLSVGGGGHILLMQKYHKTNSWTTYNLPQALKERGLDEADKLPNFHYRDDALKLWAAIKEFVNDILAIYYRSDDDVVKDYELQHWIKDLHDYGYPVTDGHDDHGVPKSFESRQKLCDFLTAIIFTCSCQHAAVNFSQFDVYSFPPNSPALMRQPSPTRKGEVEMKHLMKCLPTKHQAANTLAVVYNLTRIFPDEKFIGDYPERLFIDSEAEDAISKFRRKLRGISIEIEGRNKTLEEPYRYPYLLPSRVPNSIAI